MSRLLQRIGLFSFHRPWAFIAVWVAALAVIGTLIGINGVQLTTTMTIDGTPSQRVLDKLSTEIPDATGGQGSLVITSEDGKDLADHDDDILNVLDHVYGRDHVVGTLEEAQEPYRKQMEEQQKKAEQLPATQRKAFLEKAQQGAESQFKELMDKYGFAPLVADGMPVPSVLMAEDGKTALFQFQLDEQVQSLPPADVEALIDAAKDAGAGVDLRVLPGESMSFPAIELGAGEAIGLIVAVIVLILALGSAFGGAVPLITGLVAVGVGVGTAFAANGSEPIMAYTPVLALMVGLAVGMDYALFIVNRQRQLIRSEHLSAGNAAGRAVGTAGSAVVFAGLTVIIALGGLAAVGISMLSSMAIVAALTVAFAVIAAITLVPSLMGVIGERIVPARARAKADKEDNHHPVARAWAQFVDRRRWRVLIGLIAVTIVAALPAMNMTLGMPNGATKTVGSEERISYDTIGDSFGDGFNGPLMVVAENSKGIDEAESAKISDTMMAVDGVRFVQALGSSDDRHTVAFMAIPETGPSDEKTTDLVKELREITVDGIDGNLGVTGQTAIMIDMSDTFGEAFPYYIAIISVLSMIILLLVFRSILVPLLATAGFLLTILSTLGLTTLVFQDGWLGSLFGVEPHTPIVPMIPIMATGILYGLAMDYQVFLASTMRDRYLRGESPRRAIVHGFSLTSRVVVAAAVIMTSVFAGFIFSGDPTVGQIGFTLAAGILIDAFVVRMAIIPAAFSILGRATWWLPRWLDRILPDLDVEGHKLESAAQESEASHPA